MSHRQAVRTPPAPTSRRESGVGLEGKCVAAGVLPAVPDWYTFRAGPPPEPSEAGLWFAALPAFGVTASWRTGPIAAEGRLSPRMRTTANSLLGTGVSAR